MKNQEAIEFLKNMIDREAIGFVCPEREGDVAIWQYHVEALQMAISALKAQDSKTRKICDTCKHNPPSKKWPCVDCDMREPADRWESKDVTDTNVGDMVSRAAAIDAIVNTVSEIGLHDNSEVARYGATFRQHEIIDIIEGMPSAQPDIIRCKDCEYGVQDEYGRWYCRSLGYQIGDEDGNGFCSDAERRTDG